jgi:Fe-S-cluster containining protein
MKHILNTYGDSPGKCNCCGQCCRALSIDYSKVELKRQLEYDLELLGRHPDHRHREQILLFKHDVEFILKYWQRISREKALSINPALAGRGTEERYFFCCSCLGDDGSCAQHLDRPQVCRGYPWYGQLPRPDALFALPCGYEIDLEWYAGILSDQEQEN